MANLPSRAPVSPYAPARLVLYGKLLMIHVKTLANRYFNAQ
ncbi:MAG: hypothetical protein WA733_16095 [Methylocystis sp.]